MEKSLPGEIESNNDGEDTINTDSNVLFMKNLREQLGENAFNNGDKQPEEKPELVPLDIRIKSPKWEFRVHAFNDLKEKFEASPINNIPDNLIRYEESFSIWLSDRNVSAQKAAVETISAFFEKCSSSTAILSWPNIVGTILEKCMIQSRLLPSCVVLMTNALAVLETKPFQGPIDDFLDKYLDKKGNAAVRGPIAKQMAGLFNSIEKLIRLFGPSKFDIHSLLPRVSKYTAVTDNLTKQAAYGVLQEVFVWLKNSELITSNVPDKQKVELERRCATVTDDNPRATRWFRKDECQDNKFEEIESASMNKGSSILSNTIQIDVYEMLTEVDVLKEFQADQWEKSIIESIKWQQKQAAFDQFTKACEKAKRLKSGDYSIFVSTSIKAIQTEGNLVVVSSALKACCAMANGLRKNFLNYAKPVCLACISKFGDRQKTISVAVLALMDALLLCIPLESVIDDIGRAVTDKNPYVRENILSWTLKALNHPNHKDGIPKLHQKLLSFALETIDDSSKPVRYVAGEIISHLLIKGPKPEMVKRALENLPSKKKSITEEIINKIQNQEDGTTRSDKPYPSPTAVIAQTGTKMSPSRSDKFVTNKTAKIGTRSGIGNAQAKARAKSGTFQSQQSAKQDTAKEEPLNEPVVDAAVASDLVAEAMGEAGIAILEGFKEKGWQPRRDALELFGLWLEEHPVEAISHMESFSIFLKSCTHDFKESNFNINKSAIEAARKLCLTAGEKLSKSCACVFLKGYADKIADAKIGPPYKILIETYASQFSPRFVIAIIVSVALGLTNPKVHAETCNLIEQLIIDFGPQDVDLSKVLEFGSIVLEKRAPVSRSAAIKMIGLVYRYLGPTTLKLLGNDIKPSVLEEIQSAGTKALADCPAPSIPTKRCRLSTLPSKSLSNQARCQNEPALQLKEQLGAQLLEQLPKISVKDSITPQLLKELSDSKWKTRKDAAIKIHEIVSMEGKRHISSQGLSELFSILRGRIQKDPNRPTVKELLNLVATLGDALGQQGSKQYVKTILPAVFSKFSDKTPYIREGCIQSSNAWLKSAGTSLWLSCMVSSQALSNAGEEREALTHLLTELEDQSLIDATDTDGRTAMESLISTLFDLALDRSQAVRANVETALLKFAVVLPSSLFQHELRNSKRANIASLRPLLTQCLHIAQDAVTPTGMRDGPNSCISKGKVALSSRPAAAGVGVANPDGFVVKLQALSNVTATRRLETFRKSKWPLMLASEEIEQLQSIWRLFVNDPLLSAMFEKAQANKVLKAVEFWQSFISFPDNFESIASPEAPLLEILYKWIISRIVDSNGKVVLIATDLLTTLTELCSPNSSYYEISSSALLSCVLPQLIERAGTIGSTQPQIRDRLHECVRTVALNCPSQSAFVVLMRGTASYTKKVICVALEELSVLISKVGPTACQNLQRDVAKLISLAGNSNDSLIRNSAIKALASLYPFLGVRILDLLKIQPDIKENVLEYIQSHPEFLPEIQSAEEQLCDYRETSPGDKSVDQTNDVKENNQQKGSKDDQQMEINDFDDDIVVYNETGLKDFGMCFEDLLDKLGFELTLCQTQEQLESYDQEIEDQEVLLYYQDLDEECRRLCEGKFRPNECDMCYLNGKLRLEESVKGNGKSLRILEELRKLYRPDASSIAEGCTRLNLLLDSEHNDVSIDWQTILASELIGSCTNALAFCFDVKRLSRSEVERDVMAQAGHRLTELISKLAKNKKTLHRISPLQLTNLFKMLLLAMSCHGTWSGCPEEEQLVKRLNSIVANHVMAVVTPRNACNLVGMVIDFLLDDRETLGLEAALTMRVHRKLMRKLNSKHLINLSDQEKQYYLRILDTAVISLMRLDSHPVFSQVPSLTDIPSDLSQESFEEDYHNLSKLKAQMEILIKELVFIAIVVLGYLCLLPFVLALLYAYRKNFLLIIPWCVRSSLSGLYFRDIGYFTLPATVQSSGSVDIPRCESQDMMIPLTSNKETTKERTPNLQRTEDPRCYRINQFLRARLESLMNHEYSNRIIITVCPNFLEVPDPISEDSTYEAWHLWFSQHGEKLKTPPLHFPPFSVNEFIVSVPEGMTLASVDKTLAANWANRRETRAGTDLKAANDLLQYWKRTLDEVQHKTGISGDVNAAIENAKNNIERGIPPYELIAQYVRKTISICTDCGLLRPDAKLSTPSDVLH